METIAATLLTITTFLGFASCKTVVVEPTRPAVRTTTTEETTVRHPGGSTTTEVRRY
jgi:hypothetical protein